MSWTGPRGLTSQHSIHFHSIPIEEFNSPLFPCRDQSPMFTDHSDLRVPACLSHCLCAAGYWHSVSLRRAMCSWAVFAGPQHLVPASALSPICHCVIWDGWKCLGHLLSCCCPVLSLIPPKENRTIWVDVITFRLCCFSDLFCGNQWTKPLSFVFENI